MVNVLYIELDKNTYQFPLKPFMSEEFLAKVYVL